MNIPSQSYWMASVDFPEYEQLSETLMWMLRLSAAE